MAAAQPHCSLNTGTLRGVYITHATGAIVGVGPIDALNMLQFNGDGTFVAISTTVSINGTIFRFTNTPGTYTLNSDCTGSMTSGSGAGASTYDFMASPDGETIDWIATNPGEVCTGVLKRVWR